MERFDKAVPEVYLHRMPQAKPRQLGLSDWGIALDPQHSQVIVDATGDLGRDCETASDKRDAIVRFGKYAIPSVFWAAFNQPAPCLLRIEFQRGRPECVEFRTVALMAGYAIAGLREFPIRDLVAHATVVVGGPTDAAGESIEDSGMMVGDRGAAMLRALVETTGEKPKRGRPIPDAVLERIATKYRIAVANGSRSPTKDVAEAEHHARSTVAKWVMEARRRGFLGEAEAGRAGETQSKGTKRGQRR